MIRVQAEDFDIAAEMEAIASHSASLGAIASFVGVVRDMRAMEARPSMTLEHIPDDREDAARDRERPAAAGRWRRASSSTATPPRAGTGSCWW